MRNPSLALLLPLISAASAVEIRVATFNLGAHFSVSSGGNSFPDYSIGEPGSPDYESARAVLARIDADVVALQEITTNDVSAGENPNDLQDLAAALGYDHVYVAPVTGTAPLSAPFDTTLRNAYFSRYPFLFTAAIRSPEGAKELARFHAVVKVDVPGTTGDPVLISAHLKPEDGSNRFRRAVEMKRLAGYLTTEGFTGDDNFIILGDFNLNPNYEDWTFTSVPTDDPMPDLYDLGDDITLPVHYFVNPLSYFPASGVFLLDPRQLNGSTATLQSGYAIDLMLLSPALAARPVETEIYNSALDIPDNPGLPKAGSPPAANTSTVASDHYAVFADLELDPIGPYTFTAPGQTVVEDFGSFLGHGDPAPWVTSGGPAWRGRDDGKSGTPGLRAYGPAADPALGFIPQGAGTTASATFVNQSAVPLTALQIAFDVEQWRSAPSGTADNVSAALYFDGQTIPLPGLSHAASQGLPSGAVPGGLVTPKSTTVAGLQIPAGASFELRVAFSPGAGGGAPPTEVFLNEFHYENTGDDAGEFIEVVVGQGFPRPSDIGVVLYNGNVAASGLAYDTLDLTSDFTLAGASNGFDIYLADFPQDGIQNGARDGFALVDKATPQVLQLLSYEGTFEASEGPAAGLTSVSVGVSQSTSTAVGSSLRLTGSGSAYPVFSWAASSGTNTGGSPNSGQTFVNPVLLSQGLAIDHLSVTFISPDSDNDGQSDADELAFGTDPFDAGSVFKPVLARAAAPPHGLELSFPGASGISYTVEYGTTLSDWQDLSSHLGSGQAIVVPLPSVEPGMFFRVRAD